MIPQKKNQLETFYSNKFTFESKKERKKEKKFKTFP
jgi:hypothetical protein